MPRTYILHQDLDNWYTNKNFLYLLWFNPSLWTIIYNDKKVILIFDPRYFDKVKTIKKSVFRKFFMTEDLEVKCLLLNLETESKIEKYLKWEDLILEKDLPTYFYKKLKSYYPKSISFVENLFLEKRIVKNQKEISYIRQAIKIINKTFHTIENLAKSGDLIWKKEIELRRIIQKSILDLWWEWESFPSIIAFWKNSSIPHHESWNTKIWNWPLLIDMWAIYNWYSSDFSRTIWIWEKNEKFEEFRKVKLVVQKAHDLWIKYVKDLFKNNESVLDFTWRDLDKIVRDYIVEAWYGKYFTHSSWHWVWLQEHEAPWISYRKWDQLLKRWMVFTIEPWIYLPWNFWVRIEDIVIL